jgi:hypothetical protein
VTLLEGKVEARQLTSFADGQFARLVFRGRAKGASLLDSDGDGVPLAKLLACVRGAAYVIGTSSGDFHAGALEAALKAIPQGLHGALLAAFPLPGAYAERIAQIVLANFARPAGLRIQDVAHMARLSLAWIAVQQGVARFAGRTDADPQAATPFEADYAAYSRWGAGVEALRAQVADLPAEARNALLALAAGFAMAIASCGTPMFLLPDAHPLLRRFFKAFAAWDGGAAPR